MPSCWLYSVWNIKVGRVLQQSTEKVKKILVSRTNDAFDLVNIMKSVKLESDETAVSFDVTSLYTCLPIMNSLDNMHYMLITDTSLRKRCHLTPAEIIIGLELYVTSTDFTFKHTIQTQSEGIVIGSPHI